MGHAREGVGAFGLEGLGVGDVVGGELSRAGVEGGEEGFGEGEFGHGEEAGVESGGGGLVAIIVPPSGLETEET